MKRIAFITAALGLCAAPAWAQTNTGTVQIDGTVSAVVSIAHSSSSPIGSATATNLGPGNDLNAVINMGDVAASTAAYEGGMVTMAIRSSSATGYTVQGQVTSSSGMLVSGSAANDIDLTDFGFGLQNLRAGGTGANVDLAGSGSAIVAAPANFNNNPSTAAKDGNGVPAFTTTLNDLAAATDLVTAANVLSTGGGTTSANNAALVDMYFVVGPQMFTPTPAGFQAIVTFTIAANP